MVDVGAQLEQHGTAAIDPTGYSELNDVVNTTSTQLNDFWKALSGRNDYRAPESVYQPNQSPEAKTEAQQSEQDRGLQLASAGEMQNPNNYYAGLMNGTVPSLADRQMQQGIAQAQQQQMAAAGSASGMNRAAAFRNAQNNAANMTAQGAIQGANQRVQEQQMGAQGYSQGIQAQSNMFQGLRSGDVGEQQGIMGLQNQSQSNLNQQYQINAGITNANAANEAKATGGLMQLGGSLLGGLSDIRAKEDIHNLTPGVLAERPSIWGHLSSAFEPNKDQNPNQNNGQMFNEQDSKNFAQVGSNIGSAIGGGDSGGATSAIGMGGGLGIGSDKNIKTDIKKEADMSPSAHALDHVQPYQFSYKDGFADYIAKQEAQQSPNPKASYMNAFQDAKEPRIGVMAQDLEKSPEGKQVVKDGPIGKMIDGKRALGFLLATQADIHHRLSRLEGRA
jgi:hypothetical protein